MMMDDTCVCCGAPVPEGSMVCWLCEKKAAEGGLNACGDH